MARLPLFRFRFSLIVLSKISTRKLLTIINLGIFISIFAVSAAIISIYFENKIDKIERTIIEQEANYIVYNNWLNRAPKIINEINIVTDQKRKMEDYSPILKELMKHNFWTFYGNKETYYDYWGQLRNLIEINFQIINLSLSDALLVADSEYDIQTIIEKRSEKNALIKKFDKEYYKKLSHDAAQKKEDLGTEKDFLGYVDLVEGLKPLLKWQRKYFLEFALQYFSLKKLNFQKDITISRSEITEISALESKLILTAFFIQFIIFLLVQFFEITIEQENIKRRKKK